MRVEMLDKTNLAALLWPLSVEKQTWLWMWWLRGEGGVCVVGR